MYPFLAEGWMSIPVLLGIPFLKGFPIFPTCIPYIYPYQVDRGPDWLPRAFALVVYVKAGRYLYLTTMKSQVQSLKY